MRARTSQRRCAGAFLSALSTALLLGRYSSPIPRADDCICWLPFPPPERRDDTSNNPACRHLSAIRHTRRAFPLCCMLRATLRPSCSKYRAAAASGRELCVHVSFQGQQRAKPRNAAHRLAVRANILGSLFAMRPPGSRPAKYPSSAFRFQNTIIPGTRIISAGHAFSIESLLPFTRRQPPAPRRLS